MSDVEEQLQQQNEPEPELVQDDDDEEDDDDDDDDDDDENDSGTYGLSHTHLRVHTQLQRAEPVGGGALPALFHTSHLRFYERFKAYQDHMLGDCKPSEVKEFIADYLDKVLEASDWLAIWHTDLFDVLLEVVDVDYNELKARVQLVSPLRAESRGCDITEEQMMSLLEASVNRVCLQELHVVYEESGDFDQTALALEHLRFFYQHIWRKWDEEDNDELDYFVRCVEPRLRLYYDIQENRVPLGLVQEYHSVLQRCSEVFSRFSELRNQLSAECEAHTHQQEAALDTHTHQQEALDTHTHQQEAPEAHTYYLQMLEGQKLDEELESLKHQLSSIEDPLLRYVLGYKSTGGLENRCSKGCRGDGLQVVHVVCGSAPVQILHLLMTEKLLPLYSGNNYKVQFHSDPCAAVSSSYEGDVVVVCPGHYIITSSIIITDSITLEGYGLPDDVVIEERNKSSTFVESTAANVNISNIKFIQNQTVRGIMCVRRGTVHMVNCVLQCQTAGLVVRSSAQLVMNMSDLYGSMGAGIEVYPGSVCKLVGNGIHHCKEGIIIKDFADDLEVFPQITLINNVIHNNEGHGVMLVQPETDKEEEGVASDGEGRTKNPDGVASDAEGGVKTPEGVASDAEGGFKNPEGVASHAEGGVKTPEGVASDTEGGIKTPEGVASDAEGGVKKPEGVASDAEGGVKTPEGVASDADGGVKNPEGMASDAEGGVKNPEGVASDAEGGVKNPEGVASDVEGVEAESEEGQAEFQPGSASSEVTEGNEVVKQKLVAALVAGRGLRRRGLCPMTANEMPLSQHMICVEGNQFKRNRQGNFGTFLF